MMYTYLYNHCPVPRYVHIQYTCHTRIITVQSLMMYTYTYNNCQVPHDVHIYIHCLVPHDVHIHVQSLSSPS